MRLVFDDGTFIRIGQAAVLEQRGSGTGQVTCAENSHAKGELLSGMYVRVQIEQGTDGGALAVPQQAVQRSDTGGSEVYLVRADNRAILQPMRAGRVVGEEWLVLDGLKPGDRVVVEGFQKFASGDVVDPIPWRSTRTAAGSPAADAQKSPAP